MGWFQNIFLGYLLYATARLICGGIIFLWYPGLIPLAMASTNWLIAYQGSKLWNSLPNNTRLLHELSQFKSEISKLKFDL